MTTLHPTLGLVALSNIQKFFPRAILAGGYLRDTETGRMPKDIDVFVPAATLEEMDDFENLTDAKFMTGAAEYMEQSEVAHIWDVPGYACPVQVIMLRPGLDPVDRAKHHDYGICQVWHDGTELHFTDAFKADRLYQTFTLTHCEDQKEFDRSMRRWERLSQKFPDWTLQVPERYAGYMRPAYEHTELT